MSSRSTKGKSWCSKLKKVLNEYNLAHLWENPNTVFDYAQNNGNNGEAKVNIHDKGVWRKYFSKIIFQWEEKQWKERMWKKAKLRSYRYFKSHLRLEKYLSTSTYFRGRVLMTAIRSGSNQLCIDVGRQKQWKEAQRVCEHCDSKFVENEVHFVIFCAKYASLREKLFQKIWIISDGKWKLQNHSWHDQFLILVNGTGDTYQMLVFSAFQGFLFQAFKLRGV